MLCDSMDDKTDFSKMEEEYKKVSTPQECLFCSIVKKETQTKIIAETSDFVAFLDIQPKTVGHTVIVPKRHVGDFSELNESESTVFTDIMKKVINNMKVKLKATGYTIISSNGLSSGQAVPHLSVHIIPTYSKNAVDLPIMKVIQPQNVPDFVMNVVESLLKPNYPLKPVE